MHLESWGNTCLVTPLKPVVADEADPKAFSSLVLNGFRLQIAAVL